MRASSKPPAFTRAKTALRWVSRSRRSYASAATWWLTFVFIWTWRRSSHHRHLKLSSSPRARPRRSDTSPDDIECPQALRLGSGVAKRLEQLVRMLTSLWGGSGGHDPLQLHRQRHLPFTASNPPGELQVGHLRVRQCVL